MRAIEYVLYILSAVSLDFGFTKLPLFARGELGEHQEQVYNLHYFQGRWLYLLTFGIAVVFLVQGYILRKMRKLQS